MNGRRGTWWQVERTKGHHHQFYLSTRSVFSYIVVVVKMPPIDRWQLLISRGSNGIGNDACTYNTIRHVTQSTQSVLLVVATRHWHTSTTMKVLRKAGERRRRRRARREGREANRQTAATQIVMQPLMATGLCTGYTVPWCRFAISPSVQWHRDLNGAGCSLALLSKETWLGYTAKIKF